MFLHASSVMSVSGILGPPFRSLAKSAMMSNGMLRNVTTQSSVKNFFIIAFLRSVLNI